MRNRKIRKLTILCVVGLLLLCGCGGNADTASGAKGNLADLQQKMPLTELALVQRTESWINPAQKEVEDVMAKYTELQWIFSFDDFAPEEIACENVLAEYKDGKENPEILGLYEAAGEMPEYLYYAELSGDAWSDKTYLVVHANPDADSWQQGDVCNADIWEYSEYSGKYYRTILPKGKYVIGGTWQEPQCFLMMLTHEFDRKNGFCLYTDFETGQMEVLGFVRSYDTDDDYYMRAAAKSMKETWNAGVEYTVYQTLDGFYESPVKLEVSVAEKNRFC